MGNFWCAAKKIGARRLKSPVHPKIKSAAQVEAEVVFSLKIIRIVRVGKTGARKPELAERSFERQMFTDVKNNTRPDACVQPKCFICFPLVKFPLPERCIYLRFRPDAEVWYRFFGVAHKRADLKGSRRCFIRSIWEIGCFEGSSAKPSVDAGHKVAENVAQAWQNNNFSVFTGFQRSICVMRLIRGGMDTELAA